MIICLACYMVGYISAHYSTRDYVAHEMVRATPFYFIFHFSLHNFFKKIHSHFAINISLFSIHLDLPRSLMYSHLMLPLVVCKCKQKKLLHNIYMSQSIRDS
jgi:hypothetical protein